MKRRSDTPPQRYEPTGLLAVDPRAFLELFIVPSSRANEMIGAVCVVDVCGPLEQHDARWCDSYEAIKARVAEACESSASAVVLRVDSPGGAVAGCFDAVRAIRAMCATARKPLYAFCEHACSAGYALASAAGHVAMSDTALVGSIGVVERRTDLSAANARDGVRVEFIASGTRKAYGNVDLAITDAELAAKKEIVDATAAVFFALVQETRGIKASKVAALEAGVFHAEAARRVGLVDEVTSFEALIARVASGGETMADDDKDKDTNDYDAARASLEKAAKGDDANARAAKRALAALDTDDDEPAAEGDDDEAPAAESDDDEPAAASAEDAPADEAKPAKKPAPATAASTNATAAAAHSVALKALAEAHTARAELAADRERGERKRLLAKRPDFGKELRAELLKAETPLATVRNMVRTLPRGTAPTPASSAAAQTVAGTRGAGQGTPEALGTDPRAADAADMDLRMGLTAQTLGVKRSRNTLEFGVVNAVAGNQQPTESAAASGTGGSK